MSKFFLASGLLLASITVTAQQAASPGFIRLKSGIEYKIVKDAPGPKIPKGDYLMLHLVNKADGQELGNTRKMGGGAPQPLVIEDPKFNGDPLEVISMLTPGDSAVMRVSADSFRKAGMQLPETMKVLELQVMVTGTKTANEARVEQEKLHAEQAKQAAVQPQVDDKLIQDYLAKNKIKAIKTASGLYYKIDAPGTGELIKAGQTASVMYEGKLLDGSVFDANMGPQAKRSEPIEFPVGQGRVIRGWDEGLLLLKKGGKATFYIPSGMAYGPSSPSPAIPPNSVLVFDVDLRDVK